MQHIEIWGPMKFTPTDIDPPPTAHELACRAQAIVDLIDADMRTAHRRSVGYQVHQRAQRAQRARDDGYHIEYLMHPGAFIAGVR